jgi:predicted RNA-binding Zn-ribbon protein involved in translation (DUF1610 family)
MKPRKRSPLRLVRMVDIPVRCDKCGIKPELAIRIDERQLKPGLFWISRCPDCGSGMLARENWRVGTPIVDEDLKEIQHLLDQEDDDEPDDAG